MENVLEMPPVNLRFSTTLTFILINLRFKNWAVSQTMGFRNW